MALCKYCGTPMDWSQPEFCDIVCERMYLCQQGKLAARNREDKKPDKFDDFIEAQKKARKYNYDLSYGDYQKNKYFKEH